MRVFGDASVLLGFGFGCSLVAAAASAGCGSDFTGCEASRSCGAAASSGKGGASGTGGTTGEAGAPSSGRGGGSSGQDAGGEGGEAGFGVALGGSGGSSVGGGAGRGGSTSGESGQAGQPSGDAGMGGEPPEPDTTPPTILSVAPADGAVGVLANEDIVITFSEAMDHTTTRNAYDSADLPSGSATFSWSTGDTVLTVHPTAGLVLAQGTDPTVMAKQYAIAIRETASDLAGNPLGSDYGWSFHTMRRITQTLPVEVRWIGYQNSVCPGTTTGSIGWSHYFDTPYVGSLLLSFDISGLPAGISSWEAADLHGSQTAPNNPLFGPAVLESTTLFPANPAPPVAFPTVASLGTFATAGAVGPVTLGVGSALTEAYEDRAARHQLAQFHLFLNLYDIGDLDSTTSYSCSFALAPTYLVP